MFTEIKLSSSCTVYLTTSEINSLLMQNTEIYKKAIARGKHFKRSESAHARTEQKRR